MKIAVLASGRGSNLAAILESIKSGAINGEIVLVLSDKKEAKALKIAQEAGIPGIFKDPKAYSSRKDYDIALGEEILRYKAELVVLAGYMKILSEEFINYFPHAIINIHPSLLPSFTGLKPQRQALEYGVKISGCTVHFVNNKLDGGPIIAQKAVPVLDDDSEEALAARILKEEHILYPRVIADIAAKKIKLIGSRVYYIKEAKND